MKDFQEKFYVDIDGTRVVKDMAEDIPVIYIEPVKPVVIKKLAIFLNGLSSRKESLVYYLRGMAQKGYYALAFDNYQHGERGSETKEGLADRVFGNMRKHGWVILGQTALDTLRVIDWAIEKLGVVPEIYMGGISMGGDISIAAAGIDHRIVRIAPVIATPDWMRPGMRDFQTPSQLMDPGMSDAYAQFFYDQLNPLTHLERYIDGPDMRFTLGDEDDHIPPENAERFRKELGKLSKEACERIEMAYVKSPKAGHGDVISRRDEWWPALLEWWLG